MLGFESQVVTLSCADLRAFFFKFLYIFSPDFKINIQKTPNSANPSKALDEEFFAQKLNFRLENSCFLRIHKNTALLNMVVVLALYVQYIFAY